MGIPEEIDEGTRALLSGDLDRAQAHFVRVLARDPSNSLADSGLKNVVQDRILRNLSFPPLPLPKIEKKAPGGIAEFLAVLAPAPSR